MYIILGATGHIGAGILKLLVEKGGKVIGITHNPENKAVIEKSGAEAAVADVNDTAKLREIFKKGKRLYLLNPPADISKDAAEEENKTINSIIAAIKNCGLERIVAESTYGAQPGKKLGDLDVLYNMEQALASMPIQSTIIRGAYYMSNWDLFLETAISEGKIYSLYPVDFTIPMVAPSDIAKLAAALLTQPEANDDLKYISGPKDYSANDVAKAFSGALGKPVQAVEVKQDRWLDFLTKAGFSDASAESMANMTMITLEKKYDVPEFPERGHTTLEQYINDLVKYQKNV